MPGVGPRTAIELLRTVGDGSPFPSAAHIASYAGLAPATRQSGRSIKGEHQPRRGNRALKGALYLSAFASLRHPPSRSYYDRKRAEGKSHTAALTCLARRRVDVLHAMLPRPAAVPARPPRSNRTADREQACCRLTKQIGTPLLSSGGLRRSLR